jgi:hypothetical protein
MLEAISSRNSLEQQKQKTDAKRRSDLAQIDKLNSGKKTLKTLFKGSSAKQSEIVNLNQTVATVSIFG